MSIGIEDESNTVLSKLMSITLTDEVGGGVAGESVGFGSDEDNVGQRQSFAWSGTSRFRWGG